MRRSRRITIEVPTRDLLQIKRMVEAGEFSSSAAAVREAVTAWLHRRALHAGQLGAARFSRSLEARRAPVPHAEPFERVELLFDAGDAKA